MVVGLRRGGDDRWWGIRSDAIESWMDKMWRRSKDTDAVVPGSDFGVVGRWWWYYLLMLDVLCWWEDATFQTEKPAFISIMPHYIRHPWLLFVALKQSSNIIQKFTRGRICLRHACLSWRRLRQHKEQIETTRSKFLVRITWTSPSKTTSVRIGQVVGLRQFGWDFCVRITTFYIFEEHATTQEVTLSRTSGDIQS